METEKITDKNIAELLGNIKSGSGLLFEFHISPEVRDMVLAQKGFKDPEILEKAENITLCRTIGIGEDDDDLKALINIDPVYGLPNMPKLWYVIKYAVFANGTVTVAWGCLQKPRIADLFLSQKTLDVPFQEFPKLLTEHMEILLKLHNFLMGLSKEITTKIEIFKDKCNVKTECDVPSQLLSLSLLKGLLSHISVPFQQHHSSL